MSGKCYKKFHKQTEPTRRHTTRNRDRVCCAVAYRGRDERERGEADAENDQRKEDLEQHGAVTNNRQQTKGIRSPQRDECGRSVQQRGSRTPWTAKVNGTAKAKTSSHSPLVALEVVEALDEQRAEVEQEDADAVAVFEVEHVHVHALEAC
jgi:hypothetical protein